MVVGIKTGLPEPAEELGLTIVLERQLRLGANVPRSSDPSFRWCRHPKRWQPSIASLNLGANCGLARGVENCGTLWDGMRRSGAIYRTIGGEERRVVSPHPVSVIEAYSFDIEGAQFL